MTRAKRIIGILAIYGAVAAFWCAVTPEPAQTGVGVSQRK